MTINAGQSDPASACGPDDGSAAEQVVTDAIERLIPDWYGPDARLQSKPPMRRRLWSIHFSPTIAGSDGAVDLIVKIPLWTEAPDLRRALEAGPQPATRAEYEMLSRIEAMVARVADPGLTAVRRVAYIEEINAVVMERLDSRTFRELTGSRRIAAGHAVGVWARGFHDEIGSAVDGALKSSDLAPEIDDIEERAAALPSALQGTIASIRGRAIELLGCPVRRAVTHGDLGPSNILVTPDDRVAVIDPNLVPAPVEADLAKLAVAVRTPRARLLTGIPVGNTVHPVEEAVLSGYGDVSDEIYGLCRRIAAARRWIEIEEASRGIRRLALPMSRRVLAAESI